MPPNPIDGQSPLATYGPQRGTASFRARSGAVQIAQGRDPLRELGLRSLDTRLRAVRSALDRLQAAAGTRVIRSSRLSAARALSRTALDIDAVATPTTLRSTTEVNATPTSFTPFGPTIDGGSTALPSVAGVYDGDQGDDVLTFEIRHNATVGTRDRLRVRVYDGEGNRIANLNFRNRPAGFERTLANGLKLSLSPGQVERNDTFQVAVSTSVGSRVATDKPFDGTRNDQPNFDPGVSVGAGSFDVNGVTIAVAADDTIDAVLARITSSEAGVTASFDEASESVVLTQQTTGSGSGIVVGNDSSGFLAATKLASAVAVPGQDGGDGLDVPIAEVLSGVSSGDIRINGVDIAIDVDSDSLSNVLDRINASGAGVVARFDPQSLRLSIESSSPQDDLVLSQGTTGFFDAVRISPGLYRSEAGSTRGSEPSFRDPIRIRDEMRQLRHSLNQLFERDGSPLLERDRARDGLRAAVESAFKEAGLESSGSRLRSGFGLDFRSDLRAGSPFDFKAAKFERSLRNEFVEIRAFLFGDESKGSEGLIQALVSTVERLQDSVSFSLGQQTGRLIDVRA